VTLGYYRNIQRLAEKLERWISALIRESESDTEQRDGVIIGDVRASRPVVEEMSRPTKSIALSRWLSVS